MVEYKVVPSDDDGFWKVEGLTQPLTNMSVTFGCEFDPADGDQEKLDKLCSGVYDVRHRNKTVQDGDTFVTPYGKLVVVGNHVLADDASGSIAASSQSSGNVPTPGQTLSQVCQQMGITLPAQLQQIANTPINQIPWGTIAAPPHMKGLFAPPMSQAAPPVPPMGGFSQPPTTPYPMPVPSQAPSLGSLAAKPFGVFNAIDQGGSKLAGHLSVASGDTNQFIVDMFDSHINNAFGNGDLRSVIVYPTGKRVLEILYAGGQFKVVLEVE